MVIAVEHGGTMVEPTTARLKVGAADVPTLVYAPEREHGNAPAIVVSPEAFGINDFTRHVAAELAHEGYVVIVPDYYHGRGLNDPESYTDFTEVMGFIDDLDFVQGTHDVMAAV